MWVGDIQIIEVNVDVAFWGANARVTTGVIARYTGGKFMLAAA